jgi:hypothetical protein
MTERRYPVCGTSLDGRRADAVTCSTSCRRERDRLRRLLTGERDGRYGSRVREYDERRRRRAREAGAAS